LLGWFSSAVHHQAVHQVWQRVAGDEILVTHVGLQRRQGNGKGRIVHLAGQHALDAACIGQMAGKDSEAAFGKIKWCKEREAVDVVPMRVTEQQNTGTLATLQKFLTAGPNTGPSIKYYSVIPARNLDTAGISAVNDIIR